MISNLHRTADQGIGGGRGSTRSRHTRHGDWDVEGEVVGVVVWGKGGTENAKGAAGWAANERAHRGRGDQLHLAVKADRDTRSANHGFNGLAHVAENNRAR